MTRDEMIELVEHAYSILVQRSREVGTTGTSALEEATDLAEQEERSHRKWKKGEYLGSIDQAARYTVVKATFGGPLSDETSWVKLLNLRGSWRVAYGLNRLLELNQDGELRELRKKVEELDYLVLFST